jgi:predicted CDP-diglyceride synthetase/phosphatidate cytidylyltransferase
MYGSELLKPISSITPIKKGREEGNVFGFIMVFMKLPWQEKMAILLFGFISFLNNIRAYVFLKNIKQDDLIKKHWNTIR